MTDTPSPTLEKWVNVTEAAEMLGYHRDHVRKLVTRLWKMPEDEREVKLIRRSSGFEIWMPDLVEYFKNSAAHGPHGPQRKNQNPPIT
ncbi:MAG TPA: hypothetical protein VHL11_18685 [Phototrophicaceae bacterium]|jgi:hypothetical protein|nr:hypothetical protein [Phototrophicaceae bacterium]